MYSKFLIAALAPLIATATPGGPSGAATRSLPDVSITVSDGAKVSEFSAEVLGLKLLAVSTLPGGAELLRFQAAGVLNVTVPKTPLAKHDEPKAKMLAPAPGVHLARFPVNDVDALERELKSRAVRIASPAAIAAL